MTGDQDTSTCPDETQLELLARGEAPDSPVQVHVRECSRCRAALREVRKNNRFLTRAVQVLSAGDPARSGAMTAADSLPGYRILSEIHRGGQGIVYKAYHEPTRRLVAIKLLLQGGFATPRQRHRFEREIEIAAGLRHPGIVRIYDTGALPGRRVGYVMEYIDGVPLDRVAAAGSSRRIERVIELLIKVCDAIRYAHERGIIHRDLKPGNILVDADDQPHILDFGLAKVIGAALDDRRRNLTLTGEIVGTIAYAAPEQMLGGPHRVDTRTDVYALGVIAYELLTGELPYSTDGSMVEVARSITEVEPRRPSALCRGIDDDLNTIILKALSKDPARRYATAGALLDDLTHFRQGEAINARRDSVTYVLRKYVQRHRLKVGFAATLLVVLVAGLIVSLTFWQQSLTALDEARQRETETRQIADFQAGMFADIDPQTMGMRLRDDLLAEAGAALDRARAGEEQRTADIDQLESLLAGTNFTDMGARSIDRNVLAPSLAAIDRDFAGQPLVQAALWQTISNVYDQLRLNDAALPLAKRALETRRRLLGDDDPDTLESIDAVGVLLTQRKPDEAEPYVREALEGRRRVLGDDDPKTLASLDSMAKLFWRQRKYSDVELYVRAGLEKSRRVLGDDHPDTLEWISGLGAVLWAQHRPSEAEPYWREALDGRRRVLGNEDRLTLTSIGNMALLLAAQDKHAEAEPYVREAMEGCRRVLGDGHPITISFVFRIGTLLRALDRPAEAEKYVREALDTHRRVMGSEDKGAASYLATLAAVLRDEGDDAAAEPLLVEALALRRRLYGDQNQVPARSMYRLAECRRALGRLDEALPLYREAAAIRRVVLPPDDPDLSASLLGLGRALLESGQAAEAEAVLRECVDLLHSRPTQDGTLGEAEALLAESRRVQVTALGQQ